MTWCHYLLCQHCPKALISQFMCTGEMKNKTKTDDTNVSMYKNQNVILFTTKDTSSAYYVVHWSGLWQLMGVPEKCFVLIFTIILVTESYLWCMKYQPASPLDRSALGGYKTTDTRSTWRDCLHVFMSVHNGHFSPMIYATAQNIFFLPVFDSLVLKRLTMWQSRRMFEWCILTANKAGFNIGNQNSLLKVAVFFSQFASFNISWV